jgi:integrase
VVVPPKTEAGRRTVAIPPHVLPDLEAHLGAWAEPGAGGLLFPAPEGGPIRRSNFTRRVWHPACQAVGIEGSVSMICAIPATRWRRQREPALGS